MQIALENLSKEELIALFHNREKESGEQIEKAHRRISDLEFQLAQYKRILFGQKRERFEGDKKQTSLPFGTDPQEVQKQEEEVREKISYER